MPEISPYSALYIVFTSGSTGNPSIGKGTGALTWVIQPHAPDKLAAIGTVGKLWLEGPIVGEGYLNNPEKTASAFIEDPRWLLDGIPGRVPGRRGRLYRTGDLVYYNPDGSLGFIGRNDTQTKINGQRLELSEVEHHVRQLLPMTIVPQVVVDVITPDSTQTPTLAVFLVTSDDIETIELSDATLSMISNFRNKLYKLLPSYMVPNAYIIVPLAKLPMTATGKTDRRSVRGLGRDYIPPTPSSSGTSASGDALTIAKEALRDIWARLLGLKPDRINTGHILSEIGGDSIKIMSLAMELRKRFDVDIGVSRLIRQQHSLRDLPATIDNELRGQSSEVWEEQMNPSDLEREIGSLVDKIGLGRTATGPSIFLTGSTGLLGHEFSITPSGSAHSTDSCCLSVVLMERVDLTG